MRYKLAGLTDERALDGPHEEGFADLALGRDINHRQDECVIFELNWVVNLQKELFFLVLYIMLNRKKISY